MNSLLLSLLLGQNQAGIVLPVIKPVRFTAPVPHDADDPAFITIKGKTYILGTDKQGKNGGLYLFDLMGKIVSNSRKMDRPNNVDVIPNVLIGRNGSH